MTIVTRSLFLVCVLFAFIGFASPAIAVMLNDDLTLTKEAFDSEIKPFFKKHCIACHGTKKQKADRRFDRLSFPIADDNALVDFQDALDVLNLGEMPPEDRPQPEETETATVIKWLTASVSQFQATRTSTGGETVLRRLNRREYLHTVEDLFDLDIRGFDPTNGFPADQQVHHLDNQGDTLVTSGFLLNQYLQAADVILEKALPETEKPKTNKWHFKDNFKHQPELNSRLERNERKIRQTSETESKKRIPSSIRIYEHPRSRRHMGCFGFVNEFAQGVPVDGFYWITLDVEARHRVPPYEENYSRTNSEEAMLLAIVPGDVQFSDLHIPQPLEPELVRFELVDGKQTIKAKVWLHQGTTPRFTWPNGSGRMRAAFIEVGKKLLAENGQKKPAVEEAFVYGLAYGELPQIHIHAVTIEGPDFEQWPRPVHKKLLGGVDFDRKRNRDNVERFLSKTYRRPAASQEVDRILKVIELRESQGINGLKAYRDGLKAALCSPGFLYLDEPAAGSSNRISQYAIASRLSYFLWSSLPDETLLKLAEASQLADPTVLSAQVERMLKDSKSDRFIKGFLGSWLTLGELGQTPPDRGAFEVYYTDDLEQAMEQETILFTRHVLDEKKSIDTFLDSDFAFVNRELARHYQIEVDWDDPAFHKIAVTDNRRGGLLGQASLLTVTANGVDTSPIVRGVWILENMLGTTPAPPPSDIEPLDPDIRGAKTIRDQMEKHRNDATCAECHRKIDPLGFALENFDPIGRWRSSYKGGKGAKRVKVDASGELTDGSKFKDIVEFKSALKKQKSKFARGLTEKMFAYALGRRVEISDRPEIDAILVDLSDNDWEFRYLLKRIVLSAKFIEP